MRCIATMGNGTSSAVLYLTDDGVMELGPRGWTGAWACQMGPDRVLIRRYNATGWRVFDCEREILRNAPELDRFEGRQADDWHDMAWFGGSIYVAETGTDRIVRLDPGARTGKGKTVGETLGSGTEDTLHVNGIAFDGNGQILVTQFGVNGKTEPTGSFARVRNLDRQPIAQGLFQPHSPMCARDGLFWCCNSGAGEILVAPEDGPVRVAARTGGYPRGLAMQGSHLFCGFSAPRDKAPYVTPTRYAIPTVGVTVFKAMLPIHSWDLSPYGTEVLSVVAL